MAKIKNLVISLNGHFDQLINHLENHEAVADSVIREVEGAVAKAKVQLTRVRHDLKVIRDRIEQNHQQEQQWLERMRRVHGNDEQKALACVQRVQNLQKERSLLRQQEEATGKLELQLSQDFDRAQGKLRNLKMRKRELSSRQVSAQAMRATHDANSNLIGELDDLFSRWETKVTHWELGNEDSPLNCDPLESEFVQEEEAVRLRELMQLYLHNDEDAPEQTATP